MSPARAHVRFSAVSCFPKSENVERGGARGVPSAAPGLPDLWGVAFACVGAVLGPGFSEPLGRVCGVGVVRCVVYASWCVVPVLAACVGWDGGACA